MTLNIYSQKSFVLRSGERFRLLVDKASGIPLYYPNLFLITQVRNRSLSLSSMEMAISGISVLLKFMHEKNESLEDRFKNHKFLFTNEIDELCDFCQKKFKSKSNKGENSTVKLQRHRTIDDEVVEPETFYTRITIITEYIKWLAQTILRSGDDKYINHTITRMVEALRARRPFKGGRNDSLFEKGLNDEQVERVLEILMTDSKISPFKTPSVKVRNRVMILMLFHLGIRGGELLNIRIRDIDFANNEILIIRRADEFDDPRVDQPNAKTRDRRLPVRDTLIAEIYKYVMDYRRFIVKPKQPDYLFVTHKEGPTKGQPISKSGYKKIIKTFGAIDPELFSLTAHKFRHTWNEKYSRLLDSFEKPPSEEEQEKMRSYLMGWKEGSGTAAIYNKRFIRNKSYEASLKLQQRINEMPNNNDE